MDRIIFEERQKVSRIWTWIIVMVGLVMTFPLDRMLYLNLILDERATMDSKKVIVLLSLVLIFVGVAVWFTAVFYLEVKISAAGLYYRYFPHHGKARFVEKQSIVDYKIRKIQFKEVIQSQRDRRLGRSKGNQVFTVSGTSVLELTLSGNQKIILGTNDKESLSWAMKKLLDNPVNSWE